MLGARTGWPGVTTTTMALTENPSMIEVISNSNPSMALIFQDETKALALLSELANKFSVATMPLNRLKVQLARAISTRMRVRSGTNVYQSMNFSLPNFPLEAARTILPSDYVCEAGKTWTMDTPEMLRHPEQLLSAQV